MLCKRSTFIAVTVVGVVALLAGFGVLIWWLVDARYEFKTTVPVLKSDAFPNLEHSYEAGFTKIRGAGDMFWWFWPCSAGGAASGAARPLVLWLDGVTGLPPSLHANFAMFGPLDLDLNKRNDSWIEELNLLLVDAPLGTGFSTTSSDSRLPKTLDQNTLGHKQYLENLYRTDFDSFMESSVAPVLGMSSVSYDQRRESALQAARGFLMAPLTEKVEYLLNQTSISVTIYNGNLDAISNTPGQLEWVENLRWSGQDAFRSSPRQTLVVDGLVQGYFRETDRLAFYWINAAGQSVPLDSPRAMRRVVQRITSR